MHQLHFWFFVFISNLLLFLWDISGVYQPSSCPTENGIEPDYQSCPTRRHQMYPGLQTVSLLFSLEDLLITFKKTATAGNWECEDLNVTLSQINAGCHPPVCSVQFNSLELDLLSHSGTQFGHTPHSSFGETNGPALKWKATKVCFKHFFLIIITGVCTDFGA